MAATPSFGVGGRRAGRQLRRRNLPTTWPARGPNGGVFLDISHRSKDGILAKLPRMYHEFIEHQMLDISREPMEVAPTAHYSMGGMVVDPETHATDVMGLFAAGECTAGLHGANRLGGNSLTETVVYGRRAGVAAAAFSQVGDVLVKPRRAILDADEELDSLVRPGGEMARSLQRQLRDLMWECCGVVRDEAGLQQGLERLSAVRDALGEVDVRPSAEGWGDLATFCDLRPGLAAAEATLVGPSPAARPAAVTPRRDHPDLDPAMQVNLQTRYGEAGIEEVHPEPVPPVPPALVPWVEREWQATPDGSCSSDPHRGGEDPAGRGSAP